MLRPSGVRGELRCALLTEFPERFRSTRRVFLGSPPVPDVVRRARVRNGVVLLALEGVETLEAAEQLRGQEVLVEVGEAVKLPPGRYYWHEVIGLQVVDEDGRELGRVAEIIETGANDVYVVRSDNRELLLPAIRDVVREIDPAAGRMVVRLLPGLEPTRSRR